MILKIGAAAAFVVACLAYQLGTDSPIPPRLIAIYVMAGGACLMFSWHIWKRREIRLSNSDVLVICFLSYAALSLLWSPDPMEGAIRLQNILALVIIYFAVSRLKWDISIPIVVTVIGAIGMHFYATDYYGGFGNENFQAEFLLVAIPMLLCAIKTDSEPRFIASVFVFIVFLAGLGLLLVNDSALKWAVVLAWVVVLFLWQIKRRYFFGAILTLLIPANAVVWVLQGGGTLDAGIFKSVGDRLELGINTVVLWWESPIFGHGLGSFNFEYPRVQQSHLGLLGQRTLLRPVTVYAGTPHNEFLQILSDFGLAGFGIVSAFLLTLLRKARNVPALITLGSAFVVSFLGFPLQNPASAFLIVVTLGLLDDTTKTVWTVAYMRDRLLWGFWVVLLRRKYGDARRKVLDTGRSSEVIPGEH